MLSCMPAHFKLKTKPHLFRLLSLGYALFLRQATSPKFTIFGELLEHIGLKKQYLLLELKAGISSSKDSLVWP